MFKKNRYSSIRDKLIFFLACMGITCYSIYYFFLIPFDWWIFLSGIFVFLIICTFITIWDNYMAASAHCFGPKPYQPKYNLITRHFLGVFILFSTVFTFYTGFYTYYGNIMTQDKEFTPLSLSNSFFYVKKELTTPIFSTELEKVENQEELNFSFLFLIDYTGSTEIEERVMRNRGTISQRKYVEKLYPLKKSIAQSLIPTSQNEDEYMKSHNIKTLMTMFMLDRLKNQFDNGKSHFALASLESDLRLISKGANARCIDGWQVINQENIKSAIYNIENYKKRSRPGEKTNFQLLLKKTKECLLGEGIDQQKHFKKEEPHLVIIIISDFYHEDKNASAQNIELEIKEIAEFKYTSGLSLIKIPAYNPTTANSDDLVRLMNKYFRFIPFTEEKMLSMIDFYEEDLFPSQLQSLVSPALEKTHYDVKFKLNDNVEQDSYSGIVKLECENKTPLLLKVKTNDSKSLEDVRIEYSSNEGGNYKRLYYPIPERIYVNKNVKEIQFRVKNISKENFPEFALELFKADEPYKYILNPSFEERLPKHALNMMGGAILLLIGGQFYLLLLFIIVFGRKVFLGKFSSNKYIEILNET